MGKIKVAIIGSGNIGTDLMIKIMRLSERLEMGAFVGIDPESDGLKRAARMGVPITAEGIDGLLAMPEFADIQIVFDATSAGAHKRNSELVLAAGKRMIDLTPAAIGPYTIPPVNGDANLDAANVNMVTCGGQATIPIVAAVNRVAKARGTEQLDGAWGAVTAETEEAREAGTWLAGILGLRPFLLDEAGRAAYHAGAAVASNYLVTLRAAAGSLLEAAGAPPEALDALMRGVIDGGFELTGPIARGDWGTVDAHLRAIRERRPELEGLYRALADATAAQVAA